MTKLKILTGHFASCNRMNCMMERAECKRYIAVDEMIKKLTSTIARFKDLEDLLRKISEIRKELQGNVEQDSTSNQQVEGADEK